MAHTAIVTFTAKSVGEILDPAIAGSGDWRLDPARARQAEFLVCTQNQHNPKLRDAVAPHRAAFLIGRIADVVASPTPGRWLIRISEYILLEPTIPNIWGKSGNTRYPVRYTTLEDLGIDLGRLPPFRAVPPPGDARGLSDATGTRLVPTADWPPRPAHATGTVDAAWRVQRLRAEADGQDAWARMDAILAQLDRIPDLPDPADPLDWDAHGLPQ
jgi:hypothetical protein